MAGPTGRVADGETGGVWREAKVSAGGRPRSLPGRTGHCGGAGVAALVSIGGVPVTYLASDRATRVARVVLDRPDAGNALDLETARELRDGVRRAIDDPYVDILVITATGEDFCVGSDTSAAESADDPTSAMFELAAALDDLFATLHASTKPVLVGTQGLAAGSGLGLALAGDLTFCPAGATFRVAPSGGSGAPDPGLAWLLPRGIGQQRALTFALSGRTIDAATAEGWGIASVVDDVAGALDGAAEHLGGSALWASSEMRRLLRASWDTSRADLSQSESVTLVRALLNRSRATSP